MRSHSKRIIAAAAILASLAASSTAGFAQSRPTCTKWDELDASRCFDCIRMVWTGSGYRKVNTCAPRHFNYNHW